MPRIPCRRRLFAQCGMMVVLAVLLAGTVSQAQPHPQLLPGVLTAGVAQTIEFPAAGPYRARFVIEVPEGSRVLSVATFESTVDVDLFVRHGSMLRTPKDAEARGVGAGGVENVTLAADSMPPLKPGSWHVLIENVDQTAGRAKVIAFVSDGATAHAQPQTQPQPRSDDTWRPLTYDTPQPFNLAPNAFGRFVIDVGEGQPTVTVRITEATADFDLYARLHAPLTSPNEAQWQAADFGGNERLDLTAASTPPLASGRLFILIHNDGATAGTGLLCVTPTTLPPQVKAIPLDTNVPFTIRDRFVQFAIHLPASPPYLLLRVSGCNTDVDLFARQDEQMVFPLQGTWNSVTDAKNEALELTPSSLPALKAGTLFVMITNAERDVVAEGMFCVTTKVAVEPLELGAAAPLTFTPFQARRFRVDVVAPFDVARITVSHATQDFDLMARQGAHGWTQCSPATEEVLRIFAGRTPKLTAGVLEVLVLNQSDTQTECVVTVRVERIEPELLTFDTPVELSLAATADPRQFAVDVPAGAKGVVIRVTNATKDLDLVARQGEPFVKYERDEVQWSAVGENPEAETLRISLEATPPLKVGERLYFLVFGQVPASCTVTVSLERD